MEEAEPKPLTHSSLISPPEEGWWDPFPEVEVAGSDWWTPSLIALSIGRTNFLEDAMEVEEDILTTYTNAFE